MPLGLDFSQEQIQKLTITPELRLSIKILQLSTTELNEFVEEQLVENPVLELAEDDRITDEISNPNDAFEEGSEDQLEQYFDERSGTHKVESLVDHNDFYDLERFMPETVTLQEYLLMQLGFLCLTTEERELGEFIIGNLNENGYLQITIKEVSDKTEMAIQVVYKLLHTIQNFEPIGIGARDLKECLLIQYAHLGLKDPILHKIISSYLDEIAEGKIKKVAAELGLPVGEIQKSVDYLKFFDPKPGSKFASVNETKYIIPDLTVELIDEEFIIIVNDYAFSRLSINSDYRNIIRKTGDKETRKYMDNKLNAAKWLIKSIEQRRTTLYKVARAVLEYQRDFFLKGKTFLRPLKLHQIAVELGIHESTVSRTVANKYMQTPKGIFEMKYFFSQGIATEDSSEASAQTVKNLIKNLIAGEDSKKPLSDQKISELLAEQGINISRRTVAKYREEIGIFSTKQRRRYD